MREVVGVGGIDAYFCQLEFTRDGAGVANIDRYGSCASEFQSLTTLS